jgi:hypothetical protein
MEVGQGALSRVVGEGLFEPATLRREFAAAAHLRPVAVEHENTPVAPPVGIVAFGGVSGPGAEVAGCSRVRPACGNRGCLPRAWCESSALPRWERSSLELRSGGRSSRHLLSEAPVERGRPPTIGHATRSPCCRGAQRRCAWRHGDSSAARCRHAGSGCDPRAPSCGGCWRCPRSPG